MRGIGASVALPLLDAMIPARTALAKTAAKGAPRLGFVYFPHGAVMDRWTPEQVGREFELKQILAPLKAHQERLTIVSGLENRHANGPVHAITPGTWLSGVTPRFTHAPYGGVTADQIAARLLGRDTPLPSIELAMEESGGQSSGDRGYGTTISFRTPSKPLPMEHRPRKVFERLFGRSATSAERHSTACLHTSMLDSIAGEATALQRRLGARDSAMLGDYLDSVREIERRVQRMEQRDPSRAGLSDAPAGAPDTFGERFGLMFDMIALAFQADLTRVATFMMAAEVSNAAYDQIGISDAFHALSHHQNNPAKIERLARLQTYHTQAFARFVDRLAATPDGDATLLDNSILLYGSNMSNSNVHDHFPLPSAVIGRGCGNIRGGQHLRYADRTPLANLSLTILQRAGLPVETHGDSSGSLSEV